MDFKLRKVMTTDWEFWRRLHHEGYKKNVIATYGSWDEALQDDFARKEFENKALTGQFIVVVGGVDAGYFSYTLDDEELYVSNVIVDAPYRGRGLGRALLDHAIAMANVRRVPVRLQTMVSNSARRLYEKMGFTVFGEGNGHYGLRRPFKEHECCGEGCASCG